VSACRGRDKSLWHKGKGRGEGNSGLRDTDFLELEMRKTGYESESGGIEMFQEVLDDCLEYVAWKKVLNHHLWCNESKWLDMRIRILQVIYVFS
jgi:hypothetical protein